MSYIGVPPFGQTVRTVTTITAIAAQTTFTPTGGYIIGYVDVYYNGVKLIIGDDYTANNNTTIILTVAANAGDVVEIVSYMPVSLVDTYRTAEADSRFVNVTGDTMTGVLGVQVASNSIQARFERTATSPGYFEIGGNNGDAWIWPGGYSAGKGIKFDTSGRVTIPYQPSCHVAKSNGAIGASTQIIYNYIWHNTGSHYDTNTGRFTAPLAGRYFFSAFLISTSSGGSGYWSVRKNGSAIAGADWSGTYYQNSAVSGVVDLASGDYLDVYNYSGSIYGSNSNENNFAVHLLG